jgi:prephenate dehydrogenase
VTAGSGRAGFGEVCVVGAGLIGGSLARRLHDLGRRVTVVDPDPATRAAAAAAGLAVAERVPAETDLVVVAVPLDLVPTTLREVAAAAPDAVVVDVGSVKAAPAQAAAAAGLGDRYVGCHPMAGTEHSGFDHSDADLLVGATWAVTHGAGPAATAEVVTWVLDCFDATVVVLDPAAHDRAVARISHAPHAVAHALLVAGEDAPDPVVAGLLAAGSFRDGTRVAGRNPARTANMLLENAAALRPVLDDLVAELVALRDGLGDPAGLLARLERAAVGDAALRGGALELTVTDSLVRAVAAAERDAATLVVRRRGGGLVTATTG